MKKISIILAIMLCMCCLIGCNKEQKTNLTVDMQENADGTLSYVETENSPLDGELQITVDKKEKSVNFQVVNKEDDKKIEYYKFIPDNSICERYVFAFGTEYYYYFNYIEGTIEKIENVNHQDVTTSAKYAGKYEQVQNEMIIYVESLSNYFKNMFGMSIEEAVK